MDWYNEKNIKFTNLLFFNYKNHCHNMIFLNIFFKLIINHKSLVFLKFKKKIDLTCNQIVNI